MTGRYYQYPFPLSNGDIAYLHVPDGRLTRQDAERLKQMIDSFVLPEPTEETNADST